MPCEEWPPCLARCRRPCKRHKAARESCRSSAPATIKFLEGSMTEKELSNRTCELAQRAGITVYFC